MEGSSSKPKNRGKQKKQAAKWKWYTGIIVATICISTVFSLISNAFLSHSGMFAAFILLFVIILIGVLFDMIGVAVTAANETPFHSMASKKIRGASKAIWLLRHTDRVASFCNDVVGDICGIVSGAASAVIAVQVLSHTPLNSESFIRLGMSAMVAGLTIGGKAIGKSVAISKCTEIVFFTAKVLSVFSGKKKS